MIKKVKRYKSISLLIVFLLSLLVVGLVMTSHSPVSKGASSVEVSTDPILTEVEKQSSAAAVVKSFHNSQQFSCNVYVVKSDAGNILIDPGYYDDDIKNYIEEIGGLDAILLTHGHWDHIYGLDALKADFPAAPVYIPEKDYDFLSNPGLNGSSEKGVQLTIASQVQPIRSEKLTIGTTEIDVISTAGHTRGSVMYYFKHENMLFSGDTIMKDEVGPTFRPTGSAEDMRKSIEIFRSLAYPAETPVYPGHGDSTTYGYIVQYNKDVNQE